jgi:hypothetical protein
LDNKIYPLALLLTWHPSVPPVYSGSALSCDELIFGAAFEKYHFCGGLGRSFDLLDVVEGSMPYAILYLCAAQAHAKRNKSHLREVVFAKSQESL